MENIYLTLHSIDRLHQRYDIDRIEVCKSIAERAWRNGRTPDCFSGRMRKYLFDIKNREKPDTVLKVHAKNCYIFSSDGALITAYSIAYNYDSYMNTLKPYKPIDYYGAA